MCHEMSCFVMGRHGPPLPVLRSRLREEPGESSSFNLARPRQAAPPLAPHLTSPRKRGFPAAGPPVLPFLAVSRGFVCILHVVPPSRFVAFAPPPACLRRGPTAGYRVERIALTPHPGTRSDMTVTGGCRKHSTNIHQTHQTDCQCPVRIGTAADSFRTIGMREGRAVPRRAGVRANRNGCDYRWPFAIGIESCRVKTATSGMIENQAGPVGRICMWWCQAQHPASVRPANA